MKKVSLRKETSNTIRISKYGNAITAVYDNCSKYGSQIINHILVYVLSQPCIIRLFLYIFRYAEQEDQLQFN